MPARFRTVGLREMANRLDDLARGPRRLVTRVLFASGKRSAAENAGIARRQAELGRNPWFLTDSEQREVKRRLDAAFKALRRGHLAAALVEMSRIGWTIVVRFQRHIDLRKGEDGRIAPVSTATRDRKRKVGQPETPLKASGELQHAMTVEVSRG